MVENKLISKDSIHLSLFPIPFNTALTYMRTDLTALLTFDNNEALDPGLY